MNIPYGIADFKDLREKGYLYVDKTHYIEKVESPNNKYVFFIRPRRFGKSLFLSTLEHYYDINLEYDFDRLFGDLYIGQNPTPLKNSYLVLKLNFSGLNAESKEKLEGSFKRCLKSSFADFFDKYTNYFEDIATLKDEKKYEVDVRAILDLLIGAVKKTGKKLYLIIDEYDNFANDIIAVGDGEFYKDVIRGVGFVREFYKAIKIGTESVIDRIFITGASPVMLDDLTSGFNIAIDLTTSVALNEMLGFTQKELDKIIDSVGISYDRKKLVEDLKNYYNGYLFNTDGKERVYNPDMVLNFFREWLSTEHYPKQLIDKNVKTDYGRLERLARNEENRKVLEQIIKDEHIIADIATEFSFDRMYDSKYFISLLFYMGMLTIDRQERTKLILMTPNYVIKTMYWEYLDDILRNKYKVVLDVEQLRTAIEYIAFDGDIKPYIEYLTENVLKQMSNRDLIGFDERYIKAIMFSHFVSAKVYKPISEKEVENGYIDIYLEKDTQISGVKYEWVIELKYVKESDRHKLEQVKQDGLRQLKRYAASKGIEGREDVKKALAIFTGKSTCELIEIL